MLIRQVIWGGNERQENEEQKGDLSEEGQKVIGVLGDQAFRDCGGVGEW